MQKNGNQIIKTQTKQRPNTSFNLKDVSSDILYFPYCKQTHEKTENNNELIPLTSCEPSLIYTW